MNKTIKILCLISIFTITRAWAQPHILQSDPSIDWNQIETDNFKVIFPNYLEDKGQYALNLLEYYRPIVGEKYNSFPEKISLIIRPDIAVPNGFVTLAPRRTEWFNSTTFSPNTGSLEWLQLLAIHEYRHVVQYDHLSKGYTRYGYYAFGESFLGLLLQVVMPQWYFEGDAVWAETVLSDGGRGRSPRFSARSKALGMRDQLPSYEELLGGNYEKS